MLGDNIFYVVLKIKLYLYNLIISSPPSNLDWIPALLHSQNSWPLLKIIVTYICTNKFTNATWWVHNLWLIAEYLEETNFVGSDAALPLCGQMWRSSLNSFLSFLKVSEQTLCWRVFFWHQYSFPQKRFCPCWGQLQHTFYPVLSCTLGDLESCLECWTPGKNNASAIWHAYHTWREDILQKTVGPRAAFLLSRSFHSHLFSAPWPVSCVFLC